MKQGRNTAGTLTITGGDTARTGRYVSQAEKAAVRAEQSAAVAEAWAVGEKGGAPVGSTDETFHNNARHFAEQAAASVTFAQAARTAAESAKDDAEAAADSVTGSAAQIQSNKQDVHELKSAINTLQPTATAQDIGKALIVKTIDPTTGKPSAYEYGEAGGGGDTSNCAPVIIDTASGAIASFDDGADGMPIKKLVANIEPVQDLHGYANPWPAGGGKNKLPPGQTQTVNGITLTVQDDGSYIATGTATGTATITLVTLTLQAGNYILNGLPERGALNSTYRYVLDVNGTATNYYDLENAITLSDASTVVAKLQFFTNYSASNVKFKPMIRLATETDGTFSPYENICPISGRTGCNIYHSGADMSNPTTYPINFEEAGTVYGGTLDVTNGVLTVDRIFATVDGSEDWNMYSTGKYYVNNVGSYYFGAAAGKYISNLYPFSGNGSSTSASITEDKHFYGQKGSVTQNYRRIWVYDSSYSTLEDFKAALNSIPLQVVIPIASPIVYDLSGIPEITTLLGTNNIWADCGPVSVEYPADTKLYIERINAPTDDDMTADTQIDSGKYFLIGNTLYLSTTTIPAGDTIIPGTNCQTTNLAAALNALNT